MIIRPVFNIKCEDCVYSSKQPGGLILCSVPEGGCYKFHEAEIPPQTNGDKIREMTNEELSNVLGVEKCPPWIDRFHPCKKQGCIACWLSWLNAEAKEETEGESNSQKGSER